MAATIPCQWNFGKRQGVFSGGIARLIASTDAQNKTGAFWGAGFR
jgi:hypothetical protein